ncbi:MAG: ThiF family adenylyltransferase [Bacteroidales bacterium]|nr:ThiF family adenylyltransferase [Bacteroidales bacterium]
MSGKRYDRQVSFFGKEGQKTLSNEKIVIAGVGGVGSHVAQQLAFLGVEQLTIVDDDHLEETNLNRLIGVCNKDSFGTPKVDIVERNILSVNPDIQVAKIKESLINERGFEALKKSTAVFGCVDNEAARHVLNEFCLAYEKPYIDIASDIESDTSEYGGRIVAVLGDNGCLYCKDEIDGDIAGLELGNPETRKDREAIYGVDKGELEGTGPSVVSINGVVASIAVTEFILHTTGKRKAKPLLIYRGSRGIICINNDTKEDCYYCNMVKGKGDKANVNRYLKS